MVKQNLIVPTKNNSGPFISTPGGLSGTPMSKNRIIQTIVTIAKACVMAKRHLELFRSE